MLIFNRLLALGRVNLSLALILLISLPAHSQVVFEDTDNHGIYDFLDEMANMKSIQLNDLIKPYSREMISEKLLEIQQKAAAEEIQLNKRQREELDFYLQAYFTEMDQALPRDSKYDLFGRSENFATALNPPGLYYKDDDFTAGLQLIYGATYATNNNGDLTGTYGGASLFGYIGNNIGMYTNIRDNNLSRQMISPEYLVQNSGAPYKDLQEGIDFSEARGGITYSWKWGYVGLVKDHVEWGSGYNGTNIQSGRTPSFAMIKLNLKPSSWFEFNYYHGWLVSQVVDSNNSYWTNGVYRSVYYPKYMASNMFTFYPFRHFNFSLGNSIVYSDLGGPHAAYLIPFLFYKSVDHTLNATNADGQTGQNSQLFINFSSRNIRHLHLYFTLFMDDLSVTHFSKQDEYNFFSYKVGGRLSNWPFMNISLTGEYTFTNPLVYQHKIETQTYASNLYNMGHYLRDNSREIYLALGYTPMRGLDFKFSYTMAQHGDDYSYAECALDPDCDLHTLPVMENIIWEKQLVELQANYEILANTYLFLMYRMQETSGETEKYTPEFYRGETQTILGGFNIGF